MAATLVPNHRPAPARRADGVEATDATEISRCREAVAIAVTALLVVLGSIGIGMALQRSASVVGHAPAQAPVERGLADEAAAR